MPPSDLTDDDAVLEHLRLAAGDDVAVRQLRRRYDLLRDDYESLIDRLAELEDRLAARGQPPEARDARSIIEAVATPLVRLRDEYAEAATAIQQIIEGLESLARGTMKGQRSSVARDTHSPREQPAEAAPAEEPEPPAAARPVPAEHQPSAVPPAPAAVAQPVAARTEPATPSPIAASVRPRATERVQVDVKGSGFGDLLDFQEQLSQLPGVARVSINAIDNERATLIVELTAGAD
ncbi:hypothetical protein AYO38_00385 [bacterium SCGC AG-212-C10]|nr:hypothetical protein AYO38_00385 [bacterium SCGC AG-212-C10]